MLDNWDGWACPGINCTDIDPKTGHGIIKYPKLNKKQRKQANKSEEYYWKAFFLYSGLWFLTMIGMAVFNAPSDLAVGVVFLGMLGWMFAPFVIGELWEDIAKLKRKRR
jgi:hypothetical protein